MSRVGRLIQAPAARLIFGVALSSLCLYLAFRQVAFAEALQLLRRANLGFFGLALLVVLVNILVKILRWEVLLGPPVYLGNHWRIAYAFLSAQLLNAVLPVRAGEVSRVIGIAPSAVAAVPSRGPIEDLNHAGMAAGHAGVVVSGGSPSQSSQPGYGTVIGTLLLEKAFDVLAYSLLIVTGLLVIAFPAWLAGSAWLFLLGSFLGGLVLAGLFYWRGSAASLLAAWAGRLPDRYAAWVRYQLRQGFASLDVLVSPATLLPLCAFTALVWGSALWVNYLAGLALGMVLPWYAVIVLLVALQAGISLPSLPVRVGVFELVCVWVLQYFGYSQAGAVSYGILLHIIVYLPVILLGAAAMLLLPASVRTRTN